MDNTYLSSKRCYVFYEKNTTIEFAYCELKKYFNKYGISVVESDEVHADILLSTHFTQFEKCGIKKESLIYDG